MVNICGNTKNLGERKYITHSRHSILSGDGEGKGRQSDGSQSLEKGNKPSGGKNYITRLGVDKVKPKGSSKYSL